MQSPSSTVQPESQSSQSAASPSAISLVTPLPGPRSQALLARRSAAVPDGLYKAHPIAVASAQGGFVTDVDGNVLLDLISGIGTTNFGHNLPSVVEAIQQQASQLVHFGMLVGTYEPYVQVCERLNALVPIPGPLKTILSNSGAEGVENAVKIARHATGRPGIIVFEGAYHGRTLMTLSMTSKVTFKKGFGPFVPEIYRAPFPSAYRMGCTEDEAVARSIEALDRMLLATVAPETVAAIVLEPVLGEGGFLPVPRAFWEHLRKTCDTHGMLLIADEVQCGFGRTGRPFACERLVEGAPHNAPDILVSAKSIANGLPLAATTGRAALMDKVHIGGIGGTFGGNPVACAAALAVLDVMEDGAFRQRAAEFEAVFTQAATDWKSKYPLLGDARALGGMLALELVRDPRTREPAPDETLQIIQKALHKGVLLMRAGLYANCIRLLPAFTLTAGQFAQGLAILETCLRDVDAENTAKKNPAEEKNMTEQAPARGTSEDRRAAEIELTCSRLEHVDALAELQRIAYPTLHESHLLARPHLVNHLRLFPEGQHAALHQGRVVGMSATFRTDFDFDHPQHAFNDIIAEGFFTNHSPDGQWLYGADVSVHPDYRRLGLSRRFYDARKELIIRLGMRGMIAGGMMPGYRFHKAQLSVEDYIQKVARGELADPTLTPQLRSGFQVRGVLRNYLHDELLGDDAALIVWENPSWRGR